MQLSLAITNHYIAPLLGLFQPEPNLLGIPLSDVELKRSIPLEVAYRATNLLLVLRLVVSRVRSRCLMLSQRGLCSWALFS